MALNGFAKLAPDILLYTPPFAETGKLVIVCTWLGAADKYIAKYVELHKKQIPTSKILLLKSGISSMISPYPKQQKAIEPAMTLVLSLLEECKASKVKPRILLHMFSSGGMNSATHLLITLNCKLKVPTPFIGIICDSAPRVAGYWRTYNAFMHSFPQHFPTKLAASAMVHTLLSLLFLCVAMGRYEHPEELWREAILDKSLVDSNRICYITSKADNQTDWRDVVSHAEIARNQAWNVKEIILEDTPHCNHMKKYPELYSEMVMLMWTGGRI